MLGTLDIPVLLLDLYVFPYFPADVPLSIFNIVLIDRL
jgi:hypothetical protein